MKQFDFQPEVPVSNAPANGNGGFTSNVDFNAINAYQLEKLGGKGKHDMIGVITNIYELGMQDQPEQMIEANEKNRKDHEWRFEMKDGVQRDPSAVIEVRKYKGTEQECICYTPQPKAMCAIAVDFPEAMMDLGQFYSPDGTDNKELPFREFIGHYGFLPRHLFGMHGKIIAKPISLQHTNVNRGKKDVKAHYAFAKNSMMHDLAEWAGVLDENENFHNNEIGKLIGKPFNFEVNVINEEYVSKAGNKGTNFQVEIKPTSKLSSRDMKYYEDELAPQVTDELMGILQFKGGNDPESLKKVRKAVITTMKMASNFAGSKLEAELSEHNPRAMQEYNSGQQPSNENTTLDEAGSSVSSGSGKGEQGQGINFAQRVQAAQEPTPMPTYNEPPMDFDDDQLRSL